MAGAIHGVTADPRPDLVVVMADDLDEATLDRALALGLLPTIAAELREGGLRFDQSFVTDSLCCPSRATFLTGQYPHNHGVRRLTLPGGSFGAFDDSSTLATWLQAAGYRTGIVGKYLNGYGYATPKNCPACSAAQSFRYVSPGWSDWQVLPDYGELNGGAGVGYAGAYCMYNYTINANGTPVNYGSTDGDYQTDVIASRALAFVDKASKDTRPFFLYLAPLVPHYELCLAAADPFHYDVRPAPRHAGSVADFVRLDTLKPSYNELDIGDKPAWFGNYYPSIDSAQSDALDRQYRHRIEALRALDDLIAGLKQRLLALGRWSNTLLLLTSDNGWLYGEHRAWGKVLAYDESIRVPLLVRGPGVAASTHRSELVLNNDLAPTLAALSGATPAFVVDGRSLLPLFGTRSAPSWRRRFLIEHLHDPPPAPVYFYNFLGVRTAFDDLQSSGSQVLIDWRTDDASAAGIEHYDLNVDPFQIGVASEAAEQRRQIAILRADLAVLRDCNQAGRQACAAAERDREHLFFGAFD